MSEKRLIDANAALKKVCENCGCDFEECKRIGFCVDYKNIDRLPTVDAVEVPCRCKDCKYWKHYDHLGCTDFVKVCTIAYYMIGENGYCLYGERSEGK